MAPLTVFLIAGCHLLESASVECTSDMPCANVEPADADADADSDADADTDTGTAGDPTVGWVTSMSGNGKGIVRVFDPVSGEVATEWTDLLEITGTPYYDPATGVGVLFSTDEIFELAADGSVGSLGSGPGTTSFDVSHLGHDGLFSYAGGIYSFDPEDLSTGKEVVPYGTFAEIRYIGGSRSIAYFVDPSEGGPDLWTVAADGSYELFAQDYDTSGTRATNVFVGPEDAPFACSSAGAVYDLTDLATGNTHPAAYYDGGLSDVTDCAWDAGSEQFLIYSPTAGVFRLDLYGHSVQVFTPSTGFTYGRVYWYGY